MAFNPITQRDDSQPLSFSMASANTPEIQAKKYVGSITANSTPAYGLFKMGKKAVSPQANLPKPDNNLQPRDIEVRSDYVPQTTPQPQGQPQQPNYDDIFPGIVGSLAKTSIEGTPLVAQAIENLKKFRTGYSDSLANIANTPIPLEFQQGRQRILQDQYSQQLPAYEQAVTNSLTSQGQTLSGLSSAGELAKPTNVTPGNSLVSPTSGVERYNGVGGLVGLNKVMQNISQGKEYQAQATELDKTLKQVDNLTPTITKFLEETGLNDVRSQWFNKSIKSYVEANENPGAVKSLTLLMEELKNYQQQIVAQSGLTPTDAGRQIASYDPSDLNLKDLVPYIKMLRLIGESRLAPIQEASNLSYNTAQTPSLSGATTYAGTPVGSDYNFTVPSNVNPAQQKGLMWLDPNSILGKSPLGRALIGSGSNNITGISGFVSGLASQLFK